MLGLLAVAALFLGAQGASDTDTSTTTDSYTIETHNVTTSDGYILKLQRIPYGNNVSSNGKVVFLMHGYPLASNSFTYAGSENAIAYNLADAGYDVWMGNARGNSYSHSHITLDPDTDNYQFFNFTYEEIALYDLPAMTDYVLSTTNQTQLHYIGHSHGGTVFLVLNSLDTTYSSKFASAHLLAVVGNEAHYVNTNVQLLAGATDLIYNALLVSGYVELKPIGYTSIFLDILVNSTVPEALLGGTSVKQVVHFFQNIRDQAFKRWNYGSSGNVLKYGSETPPLYNLTKIDVDVTLHYSVNDITISVADTLAMAEAIPNAVARKVDDDSFDNMDYLTGKNAKSLVTDYIIESLNKY